MYLFIYMCLFFHLTACIYVTTLLILIDVTYSYGMFLSSYNDGKEIKVAEFPVIQVDGYYGFETDTCIFDSVYDLVVCYTRIPFSVHGEKYGDLILLNQYVCGQ